MLLAVTGGPGAGKTTLLDCLRGKGFSVMPECGRALIHDRLAIGAPHPHADPVLAGELALSWELRSYREAMALPGPVFFDQPLPGLLGHYPRVGLPTPAHVVTAVDRYRFHPIAFIAPPWPEIYRTDAERKQTLDEAVEVYERMRDCYERTGYELRELPRVPVAQRVEFVLDVINIRAPATSR